MRLFFALWPPPEVRGALAHWVLAGRARTKGRSVRTENLHATLCFLGEVASERCGELTRLAADVVAYGFDWRLDRTCYWRRNRLLVAMSEQTPATLYPLLETLHAKLAAGGFAFDRRSFIPHVTLLRDVRRDPGALSVEPISWHVDALCLMESVRDPAGRVVYRMLERWTLSD